VSNGVVDRARWGDGRGIHRCRHDALLRDPLTNKGTALTEAERADLGLDGLVPPAVSTIDQQLARVYENYRRSMTTLTR
jgi:malate dehydrogenase (oxaloacetate-decarboxylating)